MFTEWMRMAAGSTLLVLPGAWVAYGLRLETCSPAARLALAGALSPFILPCQFYALRLLGLSFNRSVWLLVALNLASVWLVARRWQAPRIELRSLVTFVLIILALVILVFHAWAWSPQVRMFTGHTLMHAGIIYEFSRGVLLPEDPELAGVPLAYPFFSHVFWAVAGRAAGLPVTLLYAVTGFLSLLWISTVFNETASLLGAGHFARRMALVWLMLGMNIFGLWIFYGAQWVLGKTISMPGDQRGTPLLRMFQFIGFSGFALALFAALVFLSISFLRKRERATALAASVCLVGIGLVYPIFFPAAFAFHGILLLMLWAEDRQGWLPPGRHLFWTFAWGFILATALSVAGSLIVGQARVLPVMTFSGWGALLSKTATGLLAMGLYLLVLVMIPRERLWQRETVLLLGGAAASLVLRMLFRLSEGYNEYYWLFPAAFCAALLAAVGLEHAGTRRYFRPAVAVGTLLLLAPVLPALRVQQALQRESALYALNENGYELRLEPDHPQAEWIETVRRETPPDSVVVMREINPFPPSLLGRSLWAPSDLESASGAPGYWMNSRRHLIQERGYSRELVEGRIATLRAIFDCRESCDAESLAASLLSLGRPVVLVFSSGEGSYFQEWLERAQRGKLLLRDRQGTRVWYLERRGAMRNSRMTP
jgi:hypothetical protein